MTAESDKALYRPFVEEIINGGRYEVIPEVFDEGYLDHSAPPGAAGGFEGVAAVFKMFRGGFPDVHFDSPPARPYQVAVSGPQSLIEDVGAFRGAFPDLHATCEDMVAEGNEVSVRARWQGTHRGDFFGIPPTGKPFDVLGINFFRFADGQFVERYGTWDVVTFMQQLGLMPGPGGGH